MPAEPDDHERAERLRSVTALLQVISLDPSVLEVLTEKERIELINAAGDVFAPDVELRRQRVRARQRRERAAKLQHDQDVLAETGIRRLRAKPVFTTPNVFPPEDFAGEDGRADEARAEVSDPQHCYVCKQKYSRVHHFYDQLCPACADFNFAKRSESADLRGRVALLTGGRVKIGYQAGIKLLRAGASVIVTTRFPRDSAQRYAGEPDFDQWGDRLEIFGLDLRHTPSVEAFCRHILDTRDAARLHRQQRVPDGAAPAGLLPAHAGARDDVTVHDAGAGARCSASTKASGATTSSGRARLPCSDRGLTRWSA